MPPRRYPSHRPVTSAFTLIELLAVIAIVAVLVALSFVVVGKVGSIRQRTTCANNMRQIALAMLTYAGEHKGKLPEPVDLSATEATGKTWDAKIRPYLDVAINDAGVAMSPVATLRCETDPRPLIVDSAAKQWARSYVVPRYPGASSWSSGLGVFGTDNGVYTSRRMSEIGSPPKALLLIELSTTNTGSEIPNYQYKSAYAVVDYTGGTASKIDGSYYHGNSMNYAFADGHVESLPPTAINVSNFKM
ncbi:MAG: DUF1559 domain-containing protein [Opitutaceae bacterium]